MLKLEKFKAYLEVITTVDNDIATTNGLLEILSKLKTRVELNPPIQLNQFTMYNLPFFDIFTIGVETTETELDNHCIGDYKHIRIFTIPHW